jgi:hypothetical protein
MVLNEAEKPSTIAIALSDELMSDRHRITIGKTASLALP